jgi:hypothetical protein
MAWNDLNYWSYGLGYGTGYYGIHNYNYWDDAESGRIQKYPCIYPWCNDGTNFQLFPY